MQDWLRQILAGDDSPGTLAGSFPWAGEMIGCPHDAVYHAEGDPWTHTGMVRAELEADVGYRGAEPARQEILRLAAWMHDIAKPATTEVGFDETEQRIRVRQPGHAPLGAVMAYQGLVDAGYDPVRARAVHALVFWHQRPHHMLSQTNTLARVIRFSHEVALADWHDLLALCRADNLGRISPNLRESAEELDLLRLYIEERSADCGTDLLAGPYPFASEQARLTYLRNPSEGQEHYLPMEPAGGRMILMSGLPGSGKNTLIAERFRGVPVVELDEIRDELDVAPCDNQGRVLQAAFERVRVHLRARDTFIWNATALSRVMRQKIVGLARDYDARIEAISMDVPLHVAMARNARRPDPVPDRIMVKLAKKREPVLADEAHDVLSCDQYGELRPCLRMTAIDAPAPAP